MIDEKKLGSRIRELRTKRGLTQKGLAGDQITRNMLSLIESGATFPSIATLTYLAERLEVPVGYFFTNSPEEEKNYHKTAVIAELKQLFAEKDFLQCAKVCADVPMMYVDDEVAMIAAVSHLNLAIAYAQKYAIGNAGSHLAKSSDYAHRSVYLGKSFQRSVDYYAKLFANLNTVEIPFILTDLSYASSYVPFDMILYFGILKLTKGTDTANLPFIGGTLYEKHIEAILLIKENRTGRAIKLLKELSQQPDLPYFMQYRVYNDLENCANLVGDLRGAYVAARKKLELVNAASEPQNNKKP